MVKKLLQSEFHQSMRGFLVGSVYNEMICNERIVVVTMDLGYGLWNKVRNDFSDRFYNVGASEQAGLDICCGMALLGLIPVAYSITTFLLYRPFETLRTYINHEKINIKLIGSGRNKDYIHDGISHWSEDAKGFLDLLPNIQQFWPNRKEDIPLIVGDMIQYQGPQFLSLRR